MMITKNYLSMRGIDIKNLTYRFGRLKKKRHKISTEKCYKNNDLYEYLLILNKEEIVTNLALEISMNAEKIEFIKSKGLFDEFLEFSKFQQS